MTDPVTNLVFSALADPTRRRIVELLSLEHEFRVADLARELSVSRQAVAKHLDLLGAAELTVTERRGRERITSLNDGAFQPIRDWLSHYDRFWDDRLQALKAEAERRERS